jgi:hypothetical protein
MSNELLEKVEYLITNSNNLYTTTLQVAFLASKKNIIIQSVDEIYDLKIKQGE